MNDPALSPASPRALGMILAVVVILGSVWLAYSNSFPGAFFFDDEAAVQENTSIRDLHDWRQVLWPPVEAGIGGRPFANLTFALNYASSGKNPAGYHATNLAIHAATALVLFALVQLTLGLPGWRERTAGNATLLAFAIALVWALHPLGTNIVDYVSQRTEGLMALMYLLTLYAYARSTQGRPILWSTAAFVACGLGMATKEDMVTVPVIALLYDRTFISGTFLRALRTHGGRLFALAATWALLGALIYSSHPGERGIGFGFGHTAFDYALTETRSIVRYLQLGIWPHPLIFDYGKIYLPWTQAWWSVAILVLALVASAWALWRAPLIGFAAAWFFITVSPSSSVIPVVEQPCAENRIYLPLMGIVVLIAAIAFKVLRRPAALALILAAIVLGVATWQRNPVFANELALWTDTAARRPENARAENNLGNALLKLHRTDDAKPHFEQALRVDPGYADAHNNLGVVYLQYRQSAEALAEFNRAVECKPKYADAFYNQGEAYLQMHRDQDAIAALRRSLDLEPNNAKAHNNLGIALLDLHFVPEAIAEERRAIELNPALPETHYNLANALRDSGDREGALREYDVALEINPRYAQAHNNAGVILLDTGRTSEAAARFSAALAIDPNYPAAKSNLELANSRLKSHATAKQP